MTWVLAVWVAGYYSGGFSMQEFTSYEACVIAGEKIEDSVSGGFTNVKFVCVEK